MPGQLTPVLFGPDAQDHLLKHYGKTYTVSHFHFAGSGPMVSALASGQIDIAQLAPSSLGFAIENAHIADIKVITDGYQDGVDGHYSSLFLVRKDSPIQTVSDLKGKVVQFKWSNPHAWLTIEVKDAKGTPVVWNVEMNSPNNLMLLGWKRTTLKGGDEVVITVHPLKGDKSGGSFMSVTLANGQKMNG